MPRTNWDFYWLGAKIVMLLLLFNSTALGFLNEVCPFENQTTFTLVDFKDKKVDDQGNLLPEVSYEATLNEDHLAVCKLSISVADLDGNNMIDEIELGSAIQTAGEFAALTKDPTLLIGVKLDFVDEDGVAQRFYDITAPIEMPSNVVLIGAPGGDGHTQAERSYVRCVEAMDHAIGFDSNVSHSGIFGIHLRTHGFARTGVNIKAADHIYVSNCTMIDEQTEAIRRSLVPYPSNNKRPVMVKIVDDSTAPVATEGPREGARCWDIYITNNTIRYSSRPIECVANRVDGLIIEGNVILNWRIRSMFFFRSFYRSDDQPELRSSRNIEICNNQIGPPVVGQHPRQPIAFQAQLLDLDTSPTFPTRFYRVEVVQNEIIGAQDDLHDTGYLTEELPFVRNEEVDQLDDGRDTTTGTADMISLHYCSVFRVSYNEVSKGGELGINIARGCRGGRIEFNIVEDCDGGGISLGSQISRPSQDTTRSGVYARRFTVEEMSDENHAFHPLLIKAVSVRNNTIRSPGLNRTAWMEINDSLRFPHDNGFPWSARSGINVRTAEDVVVFANTIDDKGLQYYHPDVPNSDLPHEARYEDTVDEINARWNDPNAEFVNLPGDPPELTTIPASMMQGIIYINYLGNINPATHNTVTSTNPYATIRSIEDPADRASD